MMPMRCIRLRSAPYIIEQASSGIRCRLSKRVPCLSRLKDSPHDDSPSPDYGFIRILLLQREQRGERKEEILLAVPTVHMWMCARAPPQQPDTTRHTPGTGTIF